MKITANLLSIPPYLSTAWKNISALHMKKDGEGFRLFVTLYNQTQIEVPGLDQKQIDEIFAFHEKHAESETRPLGDALPLTLPISLDPLMIESLSQSMQHNAEQAHLPPLPPHVLEKISLIAKTFGIEDTPLLQPPVEACNCVYCQVCRALQGMPQSSAVQEEIVTDEELKFRNWDIAQNTDKLYTVTNPLETTEQYHVFLGNPVGCTCGNKGCEHIRAVLNS